MKKLTKDIKEKTIKELEKEISSLREEIAKLTLESSMSPPKDTNSLARKKKRLAVVLTIQTEKKLEVGYE